MRAGRDRVRLAGSGRRPGRAVAVGRDGCSYRDALLGVRGPAMAGALWQMAAPGTELRDLYRTDPELAHALVDVGPQLADILTGLLTGYASAV